LEFKIVLILAFKYKSGLLERLNFILEVLTCLGCRSFDLWPPADHAIRDHKAAAGGRLYRRVLSPAQNCFAALEPQYRPFGARPGAFIVARMQRSHIKTIRRPRFAFRELSCTYNFVALTARSLGV
jgi:hypothetical protein